MIELQPNPGWFKCGDKALMYLCSTGSVGYVHGGIPGSVVWAAGMFTWLRADVKAHTSYPSMQQEAV